MGEKKRDLKISVTVELYAVLKSGKVIEVINSLLNQPMQIQNYAFTILK